MSKNLEQTSEECFCPVREKDVMVQRLYYFNWRGCCSIYSYLVGIFCEDESYCRNAGLFERCPLVEDGYAE